MDEFNGAMKFYEVGGAVRDEILGVKTKDVDFAVEAKSFEVMELGLNQLGFKIFDSKPQYLTIRAQVPKSSPLYKRTQVADFVLCRKDGASSDGRRPDYVEAGTIFDDLARRDFTVNAMAKDPLTGSLLDPHGGREDLKHSVLRFVGDPMTRIEEDGLRVLRAMRFQVTKKLLPASTTSSALRSEKAAEMLLKVSIERVREELEKMFAFDTRASMYLLHAFHGYTLDAIFRDGLRLEPTLRKGS